jgi:hypothetical protein
MSKWIRSALIALVAAGCAGPAAKKVPSDLTMALVDDVSVRAEPNVWPGRDGVAGRVTPVRVTIQNNSGKPVRIRYSDFSLVDSKGRRYSALPPFDVRTENDRPMVAGGYPSIAKPGFDESGFLVFPFYAPLYPGLPVYDDSYYIDPLYYEGYYGSWRSIGTPSDDMLARAIPEGVLAQGGRISGFFYFEHVPKEEPTPRFVAELVNAKSSNIFGTIVIPVQVRGS